MKKDYIIFFTLVIITLTFYFLVGAFSGGSGAELPTEPITPPSGNVQLELFDLCTSNVIDCKKKENII